MEKIFSFKNLYEIKPNSDRNINKVGDSGIHLRNNIENVGDARKNTINSKRIKKFFNNKEYIRIIFLSCFTNKRLREKVNKFYLFKNISTQYTDILNIIRNFLDVKKLKYVFMNNKQLSVFNQIHSPYSPITNTKYSKLTKKISFDMDEKEQINKLNQFLSMPIKDIYENEVNRRLHKLFTNENHD